MLFVKQGYPEEDDLVMCTVTKVHFHSVFVKLDEYDKGGMIHISEVSPGRIRNIRDFVKEGKKIVCKVLKVNAEKGYIDLSLRRVNDMQRRSKIDEIKQQQKAEKILEFVAKQIKIDVKEAYNEVAEKIKDTSLYNFFEQVVSDNSILEKSGISKKIAEPLLEIIKQRIKEAHVEVRGTLSLVSYAPDGVELVKESLKRADDISKKAEIKYMGAGKYSVYVKSPDYKEAEKIINKIAETAIDFIKKSGGEGGFVKANA